MIDRHLTTSSSLSQNTSAQEGASMNKSRKRVKTAAITGLVMGFLSLSVVTWQSIAFAQSDTITITGETSVSHAENETEIGIYTFSGGRSDLSVATSGTDAAKFDWYGYTGVSGGLRLDFLVSRRRDRLTKLGCRGARLTRRLSESYRGCTASEGNAVSRDGSASQWRHISATGH